MLSSSIWCSSNFLSPSLFLYTPQQFITPTKNRHFNFSWVAQLPLTSSQIGQQNLSSLRRTATLDIVETDQTGSGFVEIGYISSVHGLQGEVRVNPSTGFPELRFSKPGRRWLRQEVSGRETIQEVTLVEGRGGHKGQKSWILRLDEVNTVEQAQQLVGSTLLAAEEDRPDLEEGEFYTRDLIGMRVILKETGEAVGTVVNVFDSGAGDLLQVMLNNYQLPDENEKPKSDTSDLSPLVWVPFVEAIVPDVDMDKREMLITPPKGLLELNLRSDERSKKERRQIEWKERKRLQKRLIAAKKKLSEMEQQHVFHGFRQGTKNQGTLLANQIIGVNSRLLQLALQNTEISSKKFNLKEFIKNNITEQMRSTFNKSEEVSTTGSREKATAELLEKSCILTSSGKVAIVIVMDGSTKMGHVADSDFLDSEMTVSSPCMLLESLFSDDPRFVKIEDRHVMPLIFICPAHAISSLQTLFSDNDYFGFGAEKVWFVEEEKLPVVSSSLEEQEKNKILMKSPWEMLQVPVGSGGVISSLSSNNLLENLRDMGVEYIEVCAANQRYVGGQRLLGLFNSSKAHVGIKIFKNADNSEENFHMIFSMSFMKQLTKELDKLHFDAIPKLNPHVQMVDKEWVDVTPNSPNSYQFSSSIYSTLKSSNAKKVFVMEVVE